MSNKKLKQFTDQHNKIYKTTLPFWCTFYRPMHTSWDNNHKQWIEVSTLFWTSIYHTRQQSVIWGNCSTHSETIAILLSFSLGCFLIKATGQLSFCFFWGNILYIITAFCPPTVLHFRGNFRLESYTNLSILLWTVTYNWEVTNSEVWVNWLAVLPFDKQ